MRLISNKIIILLSISLFFFSCTKTETATASKPHPLPAPLIWKTYSNDQYGFCNSQYVSIPYFGGFTIDNNNTLWFPLGSIIARFNSPNLINSSNISDTSYSLILIDKNNNKWIGGIHGIYEFNGTNWQSYNLPTFMNVIYEFFQTQCIDSSGSIWGTYDTVIAKFNGSTWKEIKNPVGCAEWSYSRLNVNKTGQIWGGTDNGIGLVCINNDTANYIPFVTIKNSPDSTTWFTENFQEVTDIEFDANNNLWVSCIHGIYTFDGTTWRGYNKNNSSLVDNDVNDIAFDKHGCLWIATYSGLQRFHNGSWYNYYTPFNTCMAQANYGWKERITYIKIDKNDYKWMLSYECGMAVLQNE